MNKIVKELIPYILIIIVVVFIRSYIVTPVIVRGDSMDDTLKDGQVLFLSKISYRLHNIDRFDIIVIKDKDEDLIIKRVIGKPGDNVEYKDNKLYINNKQVKDKYGQGETTDFNLEEICNITNTKCKGKIPKNRYLALGDNREVSADSRVKGLFTKKQILGKSTLRIWPLTKIKVVK
ncbi:MAG: signal peptidase I [Bacilli bacterium]|nr:signal peptidase I [Bacilli bacterium]